jgi:hypothetical protein
MSRQDELLWHAAKALEDMRNPLDTYFLQEHDVTADECFDLANQMELAIKMFLILKSDLRWTQTFGFIMAEAITLELQMEQEQREKKT